MKVLKHRSAFIISMLGHILLLAYILIELIFPYEVNNIGKSAKLISAYMMQDNVAAKVEQDQSSVVKHISQINHPIKKVAMIHKEIPSAATKIYSPPAKPSSNPTKRTSITHAKAGEGENPTSELVALLHASIQEHQRYPQHALQMEREGKTTLVFILYPSGSITNLKMLSSSGTSTLDEAAIAAVYEATPFKGIDKYLTAPQKYQISVVFELT